MSRIILSRYPDGGEHVTVGWDHPAGGAFWQEWASADEVRRAEKEVEKNEEAASYETAMMAETGIKREGGMWPGIPLHVLSESMPEDLRPLLTPEIEAMLNDHATDPDSGYNTQAIDLSR